MSVPGMQERTVLLDGFSKTYAMTGWRMGYGVMRPDLATQITRLMTNSNSCTASFTQMAGIEALRGDQSSVDHMCSMNLNGAATSSSPDSTRSKVFLAACQKARSTFFQHYPDRLEVEAAGRRSARPGRSSRAFRYRFRRIRRRLSARPPCSRAAPFCLAEKRSRSSLLHPARTSGEPG